MNIDPQSTNVTELTTVDRRMTRHAALADPVRLQIVDFLLCSDLSSTELGSLLRVPSNLLSHHLGVLEKAELVERQKSEGDRRRSYVRLRPQERQALAYEHAREGLGNGAPKQLVFICTGNSARSPFAAAWWNRLAGRPEVQATSGGTRPAAGVSQIADEAAQDMGIDLSRHTPQRLSQPPSNATTVVLCDRAYEELSSTAPAAGLHHWSIPNPGSTGTPQAYERAFSEIAERVDALAASLRDSR